MNVRLVSKSFNRYLPGSISEMSPDYGCFVQAWTSYGLLSPIICGFIGIMPNAAEKKVAILPQLPSDWNEASVKKLFIGTNCLSIQVYRDLNFDKGYRVHVTSSEKDWIFDGATSVEYNESKQ